MTRLDPLAAGAEAKQTAMLLRDARAVLRRLDVLASVERGWRDMKSTLDLRPVFHRKEERIRADVLLCRLALLLLRIADTSTGDSWRNVRNQLGRLLLVTLGTAHGQVAQRSLTTARQRTILTALDLPEPAATSSSHCLPADLSPSRRGAVDGGNRVDTRPIPPAAAKPRARLELSLARDLRAVEPRCTGGKVPGDQAGCATLSFARG
jgi:hypothetical protein